jgi:CBS domain-containing protein
MITDRDITVRATAVGLDPITNKVQDVMSPDVAYCYEDQDAREAARMMQDQQIRRVVVVNRDQALVGIVSLDDLAAESDDEQLSGQALEAVARRAREAPGG